MIKKTFLVSLLAVVLLGCSQKKVVESTYDNGNPMVVKYYKTKDGKPDLYREVVFYENKNRKMEGTYKDQQRDGHWEAWYDNGTLWSQGEYKDGKRNGLGIAYHENGKKNIEGMYKDDAKVGVWKFYDTLGTLIKEIDFDIINRQQNDSIR